jgi:hypothetical protein
MSHVKTDKLSARTASGTITLGESGETFSLPSGVTLSGAGAITIPSGGSLTINSGATITNNGTGSGFGKVLQVVTFSNTGSQSFGTTYAASTVLTPSITPADSSATIVCQWLHGAGDTSSGDGRTVTTKWMRNINGGGDTDITGGVTGSNEMLQQCANAFWINNWGHGFIDDVHGTTLPITYTLYGKSSTGTVYIHRGGEDYTVALWEVL